MTISSSLREVWLRALERELADVLSADEVAQLFGPHLDDAITMLGAVDGASRLERRQAIEKLMAYTESDAPELHDVPLAAARRAVHGAAAGHGWDEVAASSIEQRATDVLTDLDDRLAAAEAACVQRREC